MSDDNPPTNNTPNTTTRDWTVLLYMAGDNNLSEECVYSLTEIKDALSDLPKLSVIAQFDPSGVRAETKRYELRSNRYTLQEDAEKTGWKARETDTGEPGNLLDFIRWGISQYRAKHYMVVLVGHGDGTDQDFLMRDENPPNSLSLPELREVFTQLTRDDHTINILGMDTCLMNMAEVCYELYRTNVTYLVGSEGFSPNTGWPYTAILTELEKKIRAGSATPIWLAEFIVDAYKDFYVPYINGGISVDQSVLLVKKIEEVKEAVFRLVDSLIYELDHHELDYFKPKQNALLLAHWEAQSYNGEVFVDLHDLCKRIEIRYAQVAPNAEVIKRCVAVRAAIDEVVKKSAVAGAAFQFSYGLSIYFPWALLSARYSNLLFPQESKWLDFLRRYHDVTRRPSRTEADDDKLPQDFPVPGRASVPTNKGRDGRVESMRNPPDKEFITGVPYTPHKVPGRTAVSTNGQGGVTKELKQKNSQKKRAARSGK